MSIHFLKDILHCLFLAEDRALRSRRWRFFSFFHGYHFGEVHGRISARDGFELGLDSGNLLFLYFRIGQKDLHSQKGYAFL